MLELMLEQLAINLLLRQMFLRVYSLSFLLCTLLFAFPLGFEMQPKQARRNTPSV